MTRLTASLSLASLALVAGCVRPAPDLPPTPSSPARPEPSATGTPAPAAEWGTLFYFPESPTTATAPLMAWRPGEAQTRAMLTLDPYAALVTASISVDGSRIAYVPGRPDREGQGRPLVVANLDGSGERRLHDSVLPECAPTWSPDGTRLAMVQLTGEEAAPGFIDVATGTYTLAIVGWTCHRAWSGDGRWMVTAGGGRMWVSRSDADEPSRQVPGLGESTQGGPRVFDILSVSTDARLAAVHVVYVEPLQLLRRQVRANEIVDTTTGEAVRLPVPGELVQAYFRPDGAAVLRLKDGNRHTLVLVSADLGVLAQADEPAALGGSVLLGHGAA